MLARPKQLFPPLGLWPQAPTSETAIGEHEWHDPEPDDCDYSTYEQAFDRALSYI